MREYIKLCDVCDFQGGSQPPKDEWSFDFKAGYIRMLQIRDFTQSERVAPEYIKITKTTRTCEADDILIARYGASLGKILTGLAGAYNVAIMRTIPDTNILEKKYLYYYLKSPVFQGFLLNVGSRAAQAGFNKNDLQDLFIPNITRNEQVEIVGILERVETVIEARQKELQKLDDLIKARFIEMFGNESNPFDWPIVTVDSVADVQVGVVIKPAQYYADRINGIKTFRSLNVGEMNVKDTDWVYFSEEGNRKNIKSILKEHDLLIIRSGAPGTACVIEKQYEGCNVIDLIIAHPNKKYINPYYLCMFTNSALGKRQIDEGTSGAAQQHFNVGKYKKMKIFYPPMAKQQDFECFFKQVDKSREAVKKSLEKTQQLYDSLMQEYFG